jgi:hypothetical protein
LEKYLNSKVQTDVTTRLLVDANKRNKKKKDNLEIKERLAFLREMGGELNESKHSHKSRSKSRQNED